MSWFISFSLTSTVLILVSFLVLFMNGRSTTPSDSHSYYAQPP
jgi:hypothetical protein